MIRYTKTWMEYQINRFRLRELQLSRNHYRWQRDSLITDYEPYNREITPEYLNKERRN